MKLRIKPLDLNARYSIAVVNAKDAYRLGVHAGDRIAIKYGNEVKYAIVDTTSTLVGEGELGITRDMLECGVDENRIVEVEPVAKPRAVELIKKKLSGEEELSEAEIKEIMRDIANDMLSDVEVAAYISAVYTHDYSENELLAVIKEIVSAGLTVEWSAKHVADKHSIGGVPGNRVSPIVVSVVAASGILIPKTSSRAITSPAGTADTMEVVCDVSFSIDEIKKIVKRTKGCLVWGGALDLAPIDDKLIRIERPLSLDPKGQVLASVLSKKKAIGAKQVVIDIPVGNEAKVRSMDSAITLARRFKRVGRKLGMDVECTITRGEEPIGRGVGPVLEMLDIMRILNNDVSELHDLKMKAVMLAGTLLKMCGKGDERVALKIIESGKALKKFAEIVEAQNGTINIDLESMVGDKTYDFVAEQDGVVLDISIRSIASIARIAGAPADKGAGVYMFVKKGEEIKKGQRLFRIHAESAVKLRNAVRYAKESMPVLVGRREDLLLRKI